MTDEQEQIDLIVKRIWHCHENWKCFHCNADIQFEEQIGRCVYNHPCGCRQGQGKARGKRPKELNNVPR